MAKHKVFISYDHSEDALYKRLLQAWDANDKFDFEFDSRGPDVAINSTEASVIQASLTKMMKSATHILVIVGAKSHESDWITWEIDRAKQSDTNLKLAAIKLEKANKTPPGLLNVGTAWATSFTLERIIDALDNATNSY
ncbi:TIR domain-containing protein [Pseudomonas sp. MWU13-2100]|uniref:TIR domain-containing protein n=1 Tax=Pseudomonas sp. MWU13-2100 TaxID=2935075 RepID=UPI0020100CD7|nr:TIR domain-containing protein [Pseudomonas sp. MWU13-2100]